ncbi:spore germination protein GerPE [Caldibacillus lycopersici]|uniref:Spore germination protein GerPE n=1 Tax=Perspicuibacillus lycopersici TaxID=1325689 RepID=A0AAE3LM18_9BACI|nr:spore germination protein GerPE [Perspicuibacillus lycopersici]MCU9612476.1 spore germination protein GerPE [Perspicuibacillus lycopersici]
MLKRISHVNSIDVTSITFSSFLQIGDSKEIDAYSRALAVQREETIFHGKEGRFKDYDVFSIPLFLPPLDEEIISVTNNQKNHIHVGELKIIGLSSSSIAHIGNNERLYAEARIKHIRHITPNI